MKCKQLLQGTTLKDIEFFCTTQSNLGFKQIVNTNFRSTCAEDCSLYFVDGYGLTELGLTSMVRTIVM